MNQWINKLTTQLISQSSNQPTNQLSTQLGMRSINPSICHSTGTNLLWRSQYFMLTTVYIFFMYVFHSERLLRKGPGAKSWPNNDPDGAMSTPALDTRWLFLPGHRSILARAREKTPRWRTSTYGAGTRGFACADVVVRSSIYCFGSCFPFHWIGLGF